MTSFNISQNFSNASSSHENELCDIFDNSFPVQTGQILGFSIMLLSSFLGNILIVVTVYKRDELRKTINYFIVNMALSDFVYPLTDIPVALMQIATGSGQWPIGGTAGLISCRIKKLFGTCFSYRFCSKSHVDRFRSVYGGCLADESLSYFVEIPRRCYRFHLDCGDDTKFVGFVYVLAG